VKFRRSRRAQLTRLPQSSPALTPQLNINGDRMSKNSGALAAVVATILAAALAPVGALFADAPMQELLKARHDHYHKLGEAFKKIRDESRGSSPDMAAVRQAAQTINDASVDQARWFPAGAGPEAGKTRALPEIWSKPMEFAAAQKMFSDAAPKLLAAASANDAAGVKAQFGDVGKACKNCHDNFRAREEHH
jgi:cytochrome c556